MISYQGLRINEYIYITSSCRRLILGAIYTGFNGVNKDKYFEDARVFSYQASSLGISSRKIN